MFSIRGIYVMYYKAAAPRFKVDLSMTIKITIIIRSKKLEIKEAHRDT